tara:strand:+ start:5109 stop:6638 length:1530 start_codon:yes stop_codon:yes gene_type:complete
MNIFDDTLYVVENEDYGIKETCFDGLGLYTKKDIPKGLTTLCFGDQSLPSAIANARHGQEVEESEIYKTNSKERLEKKQHYWDESYVQLWEETNPVKAFTVDLIKIDDCYVNMILKGVPKNVLKEGQHLYWKNPKLNLHFLIGTNARWIANAWVCSLPKSFQDNAINENDSNIHGIITRKRKLTNLYQKNIMDPLAIVVGNTGQPHPDDGMLPSEYIQKYQTMFPVPTAMINEPAKGVHANLLLVKNGTKYCFYATRTISAGSPLLWCYAPENAVPAKILQREQLQLQLKYLLQSPIALQPGMGMRVEAFPLQFTNEIDTVEPCDDGYWVTFLTPVSLRLNTTIFIEDKVYPVGYAPPSINDTYTVNVEGKDQQVDFVGHDCKKYRQGEDVCQYHEKALEFYKQVNRKKMSAYLELHFDSYLNRTTFDTSYCKDEHITVLPLDRTSLRPFAETYIQASDRKQNIKVETYMYQEKKYILVYASKNIPRDATFYASEEVYRKITKRKKSKR